MFLQHYFRMKGMTVEQNNKAYNLFCVVDWNTHSFTVAVMSSTDEAKLYGLFLYSAIKKYPVIKTTKS